MRALFAAPGEDVAVLNLGGIGNLTLLPAKAPVRASTAARATR